MYTHLDLFITHVKQYMIIKSEAASAKYWQ